MFAVQSNHCKKKKKQKLTADVDPETYYISRLAVSSGQCEKSLFCFLLSTVQSCMSMTLCTYMAFAQQQPGLQPWNACSWPPIMSLRLFTGAQILTRRLFSDLSLLHMERSTCLYSSLKDRLRQIYRELHSQQPFRSLCLRNESLKTQSFFTVSRLI